MAAVFSVRKIFPTRKKIDRDRSVQASNCTLERMVFSGTLTRWIVFVLLAFVLVPGEGRAANVAAPSISPRGLLFASNVVVTLSAAAKEIRYTLDGSAPTTNSPLYSAPLTLTSSAIVKARAFVAPDASDITAEAFTCADTNVLEFSSTLPLVVVHTYGNAIPTPSNAPAWMQVINVGTNQRATLTMAAEFSGHAGLKPRGFTSLRYPKRSLTVETLDAHGDETRAPLLGMPADSDWILYAPYPDRTLLRDVLAYELSNQLGHYASRTRFVEMFLNDSTNKLSRAHYVGVYVLEEKVKVAPHRVAIHKLSAKDEAEPEITGGYLFKKDHLEKAGVDLPSDGPARSRPPALIGRFPTGPGGFPAAVSGFLPALDPPVFSNALSIVTNTIAVTNFIAGTNVVVPPPSVTIVRTNALVVTNLVSVTNSSIATNLIVTTNFPVSTNVSITSQTVISTNAVVATQSVTGTNAVATTNQIDANTVVINTTLTLLTSSTYRTNFVVNTNTFSITNTALVTNAVVTTNVVVITNVAIASVPVLSTNRFLATNVFTIGRPEPAPGSSRLVQTGEGFVTSHANSFFFVDPKPSKITPAQRSWLTNYLNRFEETLYGPDFRHPAHGYAAFIDVDSFIDHHLFVEATKNIDGFRFSTFFTKDRGGKLKIEPIWDWNLSLGNAKGKQGYMAEHWYWPQLNDQQYSWYRRLFEDPDFGQRYVDRWAQWRKNVFATTNLLKRIDQIATALQEPAARNFERWPILGDPIGPEYYVGKTYADEIQYLKTWLTNRLAWMDAQFVPPPVMSRVPDAPASSIVNFSAPTGQVYVTTDGTDPRQAGGAVSTAARVAQTVVVSNAVKAIARTRSAHGWSSPVSGRTAASE
jgi:hypothetical protein